MGNDAFPQPNLGSPDKEFDARFWAKTLRSIELAFQRHSSPGAIRGSTINLSDLPTSATGLKSGDVWNDAGTLKIV